jgi:serine-type D-Ala-D-Ala carboxypeptidase (penicillin-binding protein 5/6)
MLLRRALCFFPPLLLLLFSLLFSSIAAAQTMPTPPIIAAKSWILLEYGSGQTLASQLPDEKVEPASLTKLMTAYLTFSAIRQRTLALDQTVPVSEKAWRAGGSRMFIEPNRPVTVSELIQGMIVQSGNDACIALAEAIAGSEEKFVELMNREAQRLGMKSSSFRNATGWPDAQHYTTARDLTMLTTAMIRDFPNEYATYYSQKEYRYNNITQPNRNRLLYIDPAVDGVKTGHTDNAGYCLIASAKRGPRRLISVVLGTNGDAARASESLKILNWGYQFFDALRLYEKNQAVSNLRVWKGSDNTVAAGFSEDFILALPKGYADKLSAQLVSTQPLTAPVAAGQVVGRVRLSVAGTPWGEYPIVALKTVPVAGLFGRLADSVRLWLQ